LDDSPAVTDSVQALESQRLKRMSGDYDSDDEAAQSAPARSKLRRHADHAGGDDLIENYAVEDIDEDENEQSQAQAGEEDGPALLKKIAAKWKRDLQGGDMDDDEDDGDEEGEDDEDEDDSDNEEEEDDEQGADEEEGEDDDDEQEEEAEEDEEPEVSSVHRDIFSTGISC
jgi:hypothetical protein